MNRGLSIAVAVTMVAAAAVTGARNGPQEPRTALWYARLHKPAVTPPGPAIGAAWSLLELLLVGTGYRLLRSPARPWRGVALGAWTLTLAGLAGYPWLFFRRKRLRSSAAVAGAMFVDASALAFAARQVDGPAAAMSVPLVAWLGFATVLSEELWRQNPRA